MTSTPQRLTGRIKVSLRPGEAFRLFTPRGEQAWAHGWHPRFPAPAPDDTEPGTVFETDAHGQHTIWLVTGREPGRRISYARVTPGDWAGTVTVTITGAGGHSEAEVTYHLTALTPGANHKLREFADGYPAYLQSWQDAITAWLHRRHPPADTTATSSPSHGHRQGAGALPVPPPTRLAPARARPGDGHSSSPHN